MNRSLRERQLIPLLVVKTDSMMEDCTPGTISASSEAYRQGQPKLKNVQRTSIHIIPSEVLSRIFITLGLMEDFAFRPTRRAWIPILAVSQEWRSIAIDTPDLWSRFYVDGKTLDSGGPADRLTRRMVPWLTNAKEAVLAVRFRFCHKSSNKTSQMDAAWLMIHEHVHRWRVLELSFRAPGNLQRFWLLGDSIAGLRVLSLRVRDWSSSSRCAKDCVAQLPNLEILYLKGGLIHRDAAQLTSFDAPNLVKLCIDDDKLTSQQLRQISSSFPCIQTLHLLSGVSIAPEIEPPAKSPIFFKPSISFASLQECQWSQRKKHSIRLSIFRCSPQLHKLILTFETLHLTDGLIMPSVTHLELHSIRDGSVPSSTARLLLSYFICLRTLVIVKLKKISHIINALLLREDKHATRPACPDLEHLSFRKVHVPRTGLFFLAQQRTNNDIWPAHEEGFGILYGWRRFHDLERLYSSWKPNCLISVSDCQNMADVERVGFLGLVIGLNRGVIPPLLAVSEEGEYEADQEGSA